MIVQYKDLFWQDQQIAVDWILENIILQYQHEIDELKAKNEELSSLLSDTAKCAESYREKMIKVKDDLQSFLYRD